MNLYKNIPINLHDFIFERDYLSIAATLEVPGHDWKFVDTDYFLTPYGKQWFMDRGIIFKERSSLFRADQNCITSIHSDSFVNDVGINFVLQGTGEMQWADPSMAYQIHHDKEGVAYPYYGSHPDIEIIDSWSGAIGMVNIKVPHRIKVSSDIPRICLSLRPNFAICKVNFDMLYDRF